MKRKKTFKDQLAFARKNESSPGKSCKKRKMQNLIATVMIGDTSI